MNNLKRFIAALMFLSLFCCLFAGMSVSCAAAGSENIYYIEPILGDGASISRSELDNLYGERHLQFLQTTQTQDIQG